MRSSGSGKCLDSFGRLERRKENAGENERIRFFYSKIGTGTKWIFQ
jgi:hypothetical protein